MVHARDDRPPRSLGRYEIVSRLCVTKTSEIFVAKASGAFGFRRTVVLKVLLRELAEDPARVQAFIDEAKIASALHHANVVQVFDLEMADGLVFLVMEHLDGCDARTLLTRHGGALPLSLAMGIALGTCSALDYAHRATDDEGRPLDVVHRDVSPSNVIVTFDGLVKLIDFGIARAEARTALTDEGLVKGKLGYMSPEQCKGEPLDARTDVYGVGVLLFELVTGRTPFAGLDGYELLKGVVETDSPRAKELAPRLPDRIGGIVGRCLARPKSDRFASAAALLTALEEASAEAGLDVSPLALARAVRTLMDRPKAASERPAPPEKAPAPEKPAAPERAPRPRSRRAAVAAGLLASATAGGLLVAAALRVAPSSAELAPPDGRAAVVPLSSAPPSAPPNTDTGSRAPEPIPGATTLASNAPLEPPRLPVSSARPDVGSASRRDATAKPRASSPNAPKDLDAPLPP